MKKVTVLFLLLIFSSVLLAQEEIKGLNLSLQTDLLAYTTSGGWSIWGVAQLQRSRFAIAYVNYPNRHQDTYDETGIKENDRFIRVQLARYFQPTSKMKHFFYGINLEYHWRELEEDNNLDEILEDTHWQGGLFIGFDWQPWRGKESVLQNISIVPWLGLNFRPNNTEQDRVFENTGRVYDIPGALGTSIGLNVSYTFLKQ